MALAPRTDQCIPDCLETLAYTALVEEALPSLKIRLLMGGHRQVQARHLGAPFRRDHVFLNHLRHRQIAEFFADADRLVDHVFELGGGLESAAGTAAPKRDRLDATRRAYLPACE